MPPLSPFQEALSKLQRRIVVGADLSSAEWARLPVAIPDRALFSARTENARYLQEIKDVVEKIINPVTVERDGRQVTEGMDMATARTELKKALRSLDYSPEPDKRGTIQDLSSDSRLNLILKMNVEQAQGFGAYLQGQAPGALDAFPASELTRFESREKPRNWVQRWQDAGGRLFDGRMIDLKSSDIWSEISAFGTPYPPLDFGSGMGLRDVSREEAEAFGLIQPGEKAQRSVENFNARLRASVSNLSPEIQESLKKSFGDQIVIEDGVARWRGLGAALEGKWENREEHATALRGKPILIEALALAGEAAA